MLKNKLQSLPKKKFVNLYAALKKKKQAAAEGGTTFDWVNDRLSQTSRSCRFELPMDMRKLETLTVQTYLLQYCKIDRHRQRAYKKVFDNHKNKLTGTMSYKGVEEALQTIMSKSVQTKDLQPFLTFVALTPASVVDLPLFQGICALAERILYSTILGYQCKPGENRGVLESADFCGLEWKLKGVPINSSLKKLLVSLG